MTIDGTPLSVSAANRDADAIRVPAYSDGVDAAHDADRNREQRADARRR